MKQTYQSEYTFVEVKILMNFNYGGRRWEVLSKSTYIFDAKTIDGHPAEKAIFKYKN